MLTGSLETFTSTEVVRLVAGTRKTGSLVVRGRGPLGTHVEVDVRVRDGEIVEATGGSPLATDTHTALADLLRITEGDFSFDGDAEAPANTPGLQVEEAIAEAEAVMAEWKVLESYVPSLDAAVELAATIGEPVTLSPTQWNTLSAIGSGCTARTLAQITGDGPLGVCRSLRDLVDLGTVRVFDVEIDNSAADEDDGSDPDDRWSDRPESDHIPAPPPVAAAPPPPPPAPPVAAVAAVRADLPLGPDSADLAPPPPVTTPPVAPRFQHFSPRAAAAVAATEPAGPAVAALGDGDEVVSRNVLLKFLAAARQTA